MSKSFFAGGGARRVLVICLSALALAATVAACGGSSSSNASGATATGSQFQARVNLAKCARAHGINIPDPSPGGGPGQGIGRVLRQYSQSQIQTALQSCRQYLAKAFPQFNLSPAQRAQFQQQLVKFAECMRSHGVNIPDPQANSGGGFGFRQAFRSIDRNSPAFKTALEACQSLRPRFGRGAGGAGGPGGGPPPGAPGA